MSEREGGFDGKLPLFGQQFSENSEKVRKKSDWRRTFIVNAHSNWIKRIICAFR